MDKSTFILIKCNQSLCCCWCVGFKKDRTLLTQYENDFGRLVPLDLKIPGGRYSSEADLVADRVRDFYLGGRPISTDTVEEMISLLTDLMFVRGNVNLHCDFFAF